MDTILRILILEDFPEDTELINRKLKKDNFHFYSKIVDKKEDFLRELKDFQPDLIFSEYSMPQFTGLEALEIVREKTPNTPFIIITGSLDEETAVGCIKAGAWDYILKDNLSRLGSAVKSAMVLKEEREKRDQVLQALRESEKKYRAVVENATDIIFVTDSLGFYRFGNTAGLKAAGYTLEELLKLNYVDLVVPEYKKRIQRHYMRQYRTREPESVIEYPFRSRDGKIIWISQKSSIIYEGETITGFHHVGRDITTRKKAEITLQNSETRYRTLFESSSDAVMLFGENSFFDCNGATLLMFGLKDKAEFISLHPSDISPAFQPCGTDSLNLSNKMIATAMKDGMLRFEWVHKRLDTGENFPAEVLLSRMDIDGRPIVLATVRDISKRKRAENRELLAREVLELLNLQEDSPSAIRKIMWLIKENTGFDAVGIRLRKGDDFPYYVSNGFSGHFVNTENHLCARDDAGEIVRDSAGTPVLECLCGNIISGRTNPELPFYSDGGSFWTNSTTDLMASATEKDLLTNPRNRCNSEGYESVGLVPLRVGDEIFGLLQMNDRRRNKFTREMIHFFERLGVSIGIALSRKRAEEALRESNELLSIFIMHSPIQAYIKEVTPAESRVLYASENFIDMIGIPGSKMVGKVMEELFPAEFATKMTTDDRAVVSNGEVLIMDEDLNGRNYTTIKFPITQGNKKLLAGYSIDITERKQAEEELRFINTLLITQQEASIDGILVVGENGKILSLNRRFVSMWGIPSDVIDSKNDERTILSVLEKLADPEGFIQKVKYLYEHKNEVCLDEITLKDGSIFERFSSPMFGTDEKYYGRVWYFRDITEKKQAEKNILNISRMYAVLSGINSAIVATPTRDHLFRETCRIVVEIGKFNYSWIGLLDLNKKTVIPFAHQGKGKCHRIESPDSYVHVPDGGGPVASAINRKKCVVLNNLSSGHFMRLWPVNNQLCGSRSLAVIPFFFNKEVFGVLVVCSEEVDYFTRDEITLLEEIGSNLSFALDSINEKEQRQKAEVELVASERRFRTLFEQAAVGVAQVDSKSNRYLRVNQKFRDIVGYSEEELLRLTYQSITHPDDLQIDRDHLTLLFDGKIREFSYDKRYFHKNGTVIWVNLTVSHMWVPGEEQNYHMVVVQDITEQKRAEEALRVNERKYRELTELLPQPVYETDIYGRITYANRIAFEQFEYTEEDFNRGISIFDIIDINDHERVKSNFSGLAQSKKMQVNEYSARKKGGSLFPVSVYTISIVQDTVVTGTRGFIIDLTERVKSEARFRQAQKMETVGQLAGGVAHDFNNILMAIMGYARFALKELPENTPVRNDIQEIQVNAERAANLTKQLLAFSRRQRLESTVTDLNGIITELAKMLNRLIGEHIVLMIHTDPDLWRIKVDPVQIEQVVINLAVNARDAMPKGGTLTISTGNRVLKGMLIPLEFVPEGSYVCLTIADTGTGMSEEVQSHLFEPFYTTKEQGKGTGLGLATCYGIIKQSNGYITIESELGKGSVFRIFLPKASDEMESATIAGTVKPVADGKESVLLVEDETSVRKIISRALIMHGYRVFESSNGEEALRVVETHGIENLHILLTDMVMPVMGGEELVNRIQVLRPGFKVILMSGYTETSISSFQPEGAKMEFIQKPVVLDDLLVKIRGVLDEK